MDTIQKLIESFRQFPGIGPRQAKRFVYFLLTSSKQYRSNLAKQIEDAARAVSRCAECQRFFVIKNKESVCNLCTDANRSNEELIIVSYDVDLDNVERSGTFHGRYFVLGGTIPILDKAPAERVRVKDLISKIERMRQNGLKEIIFALNVTPEGENTEQIVRKMIESVSLELKISALGKGLSTGLELEYSDSETLKNALRNRS